MADTDSTPDTPADVEAPEGSGYAVYDETLGRYTTGVVATKAEADKVKKGGPEGHTLTVKKV
jgi:hypothetical protein